MLWCDGEAALEEVIVKDHSVSHEQFASESKGLTIYKIIKIDINQKLKSRPTKEVTKI